MQHDPCACTGQLNGIVGIMLPATQCGHATSRLILGPAAQPLLGLSFPNLRKLELHGCHLASAELLQSGGSLLQHLAHISLVNCSCSSDAVTQQLSRVLGQLPSLHSMHLTSRGISPSVLQHCGSCLTSLSFKHTGPNHMSVDWELFSAAISCTPNLTSRGQACKLN
jgi:hypothetical protein